MSWADIASAADAIVVSDQGSGAVVWNGSAAILLERWETVSSSASIRLALWKFGWQPLTVVSEEEVRDALRLYFDLLRLDVGLSGPDEWHERLKRMKDAKRGK